MAAPRADCRRCTSYDPRSKWCSAQEQVVLHPTAGRCSGYGGPPPEDAEESTEKET